MIDTVQAAIAQYGLIAPGDRVVAAISGGADSMALGRVLAALRQPLGFALSWIHVNHGIRGDAADADEAFVRDCALTAGLELDVVRTDVPAAAKRAGMSLEMAARDARIRAYRTVLASRDATAVATGHTRNDRAETFLMRLLRGGGAAGLSGMRAASTVGDLRLIRPLLAQTRAEIEAFLESLGQTWRTDASNDTDGFIRNRVRHELLPILRERFNPSVEQALIRTSELLEVDEIYLAERAAEALSRCRVQGGLDAGRIRAEPPALGGRLLRQWLMGEGVAGESLNRALVERILSLASSTEGSASVPLPGGGRVERQYQVVRIALEEPAPIQEFAYALTIPGQVALTACGLQASATVEPATDPRRAGPLGRWPAEACLRQTRAGEGPLILRSRRPGDRMRPLGLGGTVRLKEVLMNAKIPRALRNRIPICECRGEIVWVPGYRVAEGWDVRDGDGECVQIRIEWAKA